MLFMGWYPVFMILGLGYVAISGIAAGETVLIVPYSVIVIVGFAVMAINPAARPKKIRSYLVGSRDTRGYGAVSKPK